MRKAIATVLIAGAAVAVVPGVASGVAARCGTTYTQNCTKPKVKFRTPKAACVTAGPRYKVPKLVVTSNAGIRRILIRLRNPPRKIYKHRFKGRGPTQRTLKHIHVRTSNLSAGAHFIRVTVTDVRGKSTSKTMRFAICQATPVFTG